MNYRSLTDALLVDFAKNVQARLAAHEVTSLDNALADDLAAMLAPLNTAYETGVETAIEAIAAKQSAVAIRQNQRFEILDALFTVEKYLDAVKGPSNDYELCLFDAPQPRNTVVPNDPSELSATGTSTGINNLTFKGNNKSGHVVYEIWRREGDEGAWGIVGITRKPAYLDTPVTPGQYYEYKVRASAAKSVSNFSNSAVVYGAP